MYKITLIWLCLIMASCGTSRHTKTVKSTTTTITRIDTTVQIKPINLLATFDSVTTERQTVETKNGSVSIQRQPSGKISVICRTDTIYVPVKMEQTKTTETKEKTKTVKSKGVRWRWFLFGIIAALIGRVVIRQLI